MALEGRGKWKSDMEREDFWEVLHYACSEVKGENPFLQSSQPNTEFTSIY